MNVLTDARKQELIKDYWEEWFVQRGSPKPAAGRALVQ
jgi:hypothetical protein